MSPPSARGRASACLALLAALCACRRLAAPRDLDHSVEEDDRLAALLRAMPLERAEPGALPPLTPSVRLRVTRQGVSVDNAGLLRAWPHERRVRAIMAQRSALPEAWPLSRELVVGAQEAFAFPVGPARGRRLGLPALAEALRQTHELEGSYRQLLESEEPVERGEGSVVTVFLEPEVPWGGTYRVLYTAANAGYRRMDLALRQGEGTGALTFETHRAGDGRRLRLANGDAGPAEREAIEAATRALEQRDEPPPALPPDASAAERAARSVEAALRVRGPQLMLDVVLAPEGLLVGVEDAWLQPGCAAVGPRVVLAPREDTGALARCLLAARAVPAWRDALRRTTGVTLRVHPTIPAGLVLRAALASRETRPGARDLFPDFDLALEER